MSREVPWPGILTWLMLLVTVSGGGLLLLSQQLGLNNRSRWALKAHSSAVAANLAEAGVSKALWELRHGRPGYAGEKQTEFGGGFYSVSIKRSNGQVEIEALGEDSSRREQRKFLVLVDDSGAVSSWKESFR